MLEKGAFSRDIVLPVGSWIDGNDGTVYSGNRILRNYSAPLHVLPYFLREGSDVAQSSVGKIVGNTGLLALFMLGVVKIL